MNPILHEAIQELKISLQKNSNVILSLPPGLGKTTIVPIHLLEESWQRNKKIAIVEPRRLAAKNAALRVAKNLREDIGKLVGYRIRGESKSSPNTKLEFLTDGVFLKILQNDPMLEEYGLIILDEFHERKFLYDLILVLLLESRKIFHSSFKLVIMSATLNSLEISHKLQNAPIVFRKIGSYPLEIHYFLSNERLENKIMECLDRALQKTGDILVFLTGKKDIYNLQRLIEEKYENSLLVLPLHGELSLEEQQRAMFEDKNGKRRIVLATNIAESSLTMEGIQIVIDSGLYKSLRYNPATGMSSLVVSLTAKDSILQRASRSNRNNPGIVYRLWKREEEKDRPEFTTPEILLTDLSPVLLETANFGTEFYSLDWIDTPPESHFQRALQLLQELDAIHSESSLTEKGKKMLDFPAHPRISHMILESISLQKVSLACLLGAFLSERDFLEKSFDSNGNILHRLDMLTSQEKTSPRLRRIFQTRDEFLKILNSSPIQEKIDIKDAGILLAIAYPDRIGKRRENSYSYKLSSGRKAVFHNKEESILSEFIVVPELEEGNSESRIFLYAPVSKEDLENIFQSQFRYETNFNLEKGRFVFTRKKFLFTLEWESKEITNLNSIDFSKHLLNYIVSTNFSCLHVSETTQSFLGRVQFLQEHGLLDIETGFSLLQKNPEILLPYLQNIKNLNDLERINLQEIFESNLDYSLKIFLEKEAPINFHSPAGFQIPIEYMGKEAYVSIKLQELFGTLETPKIAKGRVPIIFKLLSPAKRPIQITKDLKSFWQNTYPDVKKELKGKYPKHPWPDDPLSAVPTRSTKKTQPIRTH